MGPTKALDDGQTGVSSIWGFWTASWGICIASGGHGPRSHQLPQADLRRCVHDRQLSMAPMLTAPYDLDDE